MKKMIIVLLGSLVLLPACLDDPFTGPENLTAGLVFYNNLMEADKVIWKVDDSESLGGQSYGMPIEGSVEVDGYNHQVRIKASTLEGGVTLDSLDYFLDPFSYYMISIVGSEEEPHLLCDTMDTSFPTLGLVKMRFLQASESMGAIDIYIGGELPEHRKLSGIGFGQLSEYIEASQESLWNAIIFTPAEVAPADSTILSYTVNKNFMPNRTYFAITNHSEVDPESSFRMQVFNQPSH
ncbi:MAG: hypothetical protein E4H10_09715 [Bacteroidia bacterium]|nr:MAG: hypothetical protein E4H10_09715 [Bacteroidia bacterium]